MLAILRRYASYRRGAPARKDCAACQDMERRAFLKEYSYAPRGKESTRSRNPSACRRTTVARPRAHQRSLTSTSTPPGHPGSRTRGGSVPVFAAAAVSARHGAARRTRRSYRGSVAAAHAIPTARCGPDAAMDGASARPFAAADNRGSSLPCPARRLFKSVSSRSKRLEAFRSRGRPGRASG